MITARERQTSLFLILMFHLTAAAAGEILYLTVRVDDEVPLSCGNVKYTRNNCESITWIFSYNNRALRLFEKGQIHKDAAAKSDRLSVTANCSLVIKNVSVKDVGLYICKQFINGQQGSGSVLSVVNMVKQNQKDKILLICSVTDYRRCRHRVEWLKEGTEEKFSEQKGSWLSCSATVTFPASVHNSESDLPPVLKCKVTNSHTNEEQRFDFRLQSSGGRKDSTTKQVTTTIVTTTQTSTTAAEPSIKWTSMRINPTINVNNLSKFYGWCWSFIIRPVCLAVMIITVLVISRWKKTKGNKSTEEEVSQIPDSVTYNTVKNAASAQATFDSNSLY